MKLCGELVFKIVVNLDEVDWLVCEQFLIGL